MSPKHFVLPSLCLAASALALGPALSSKAFSKNGQELGLGFRDVRVFNNFSDATANDNVTPHSQFPGQQGAPLAVWKAVVEWGSRLHGDGSGDPVLNNQLGSGEANFDFFWAGEADGIGTTDENIVSALASSCGGVLSFTELPISDGWRIRYCDDEWVWDDGPANIGARWDIQGLATSALGRALGLANSSVTNATMLGNADPGETKKRSLHADDIAGIQCIYGVASPTKPKIFATEPNAGTLILHGAGFDLLDNEVWFTSAAVTAANIDPVIRVLGVVSNGSEITVPIPAAAGPGDVLVKIPGNDYSTISNTFPTDLINDFGQALSTVTPTSLEALIPGTTQTVTLSGFRLDLATDVLVDGTPIDPTRYTVVDASTITIDMPQVSGLGLHTIGVHDGTTPQEVSIEITAPTTPILQLGTGDPLNTIPRDAGLDILLAGPVGSQILFRTSPSSIPSLERFRNRAPDHPAASLQNGLLATIPAEGWILLHVPTLPDPGLSGMDWFGLAFRLDLGRPFATSNPQSIHLVQ